MSLFTKLFHKKENPRPYCSAIIAAAGISERMEGEDKPFIELCGKPILARTLEAFQNCRSIDEIIIVAREDRLVRVSDLCGAYHIDKASKIIVGGATRAESVSNGALAVSKAAQLIAIHDGARPCVSPEIIERTVEAASMYHAAAPAVKLSSTVKRVKNGVITGTMDREDLVEIQTPQVFDAPLIKAALKNSISKALMITDDCMAVELLGIPVRITEGSGHNIKITVKEDMVIAEAIIRKAETCI